ncbi:MAG: aldehyde dehydrogenase family protein [Myxococcales bacterium]|nr:aldehyde dehydrogenase family protein [Myxococcales bacterium]
MATAVSFLPNTARIREVFERQRATALRLRTSTADQRIAKLKKLRDAVIANSEVWYRAGHDDFKKPKGEVDLAEILPVVMEANDAIKHLASWMKPTSVMPTLLTAGTSSQVKYEPRGRCLIISPWNYPLNLTFGPLVSAIAAGNTAIIKPSEMTPNLSAAMTKLVGELFTEDEVAIFEGEAAVSQALLELPFDHIFFTGSPAIGKVVMAAAAKHLTSVTLELGGKSPTIIDATADLDLAAKNIMWGKFTNAGQTCIAPDHIFVHRSVKDAFVAKTKVVLEKAYGKDGSPPSEHLAHVVNARHTARVKALLDDAKAKGARVLFGGQVDEKINSIAPTLLDGISPDSKIMQEEIFGPLLPLFEFDSLDEVITKINAEPKPLALYIYSSDDAAVEKVLGETSSGGACVNHAVLQFGHGNLPFGGVNNSGIGNAHGLYGFRAFSHERAVMRTQLKLSPMLLGPGQLPERIRSVLKSFMKWL